MPVSELPNAIVSGLLLAGLYVVVGLAWVLLFRATKILNFATGQFVLLGAYLYFVASARVGAAFVLSLVGAVVAMALVGALIQFVLLRRMAGVQAHAVGHSPFAAVILTFGISTVIQHAVTMIFGPSTVALPVPLPKHSITFPGHVAITTEGIFVWVIASALLVSTILLIRYSKWGIQMRAAAENAVLASQSGINVDSVFLIGWVAAASICALAGISYGYSTVLTPDLANIGIRGLAPVIVGGMDSAAGVLPGAVIVRVGENVLVLIFGESVRDAAVMLVLLLVLAVRPTGVFGSRDIRRI